jgi:protein-disulfide isomerase
MEEETLTKKEKRALAKEQKKQAQEKNLMASKLKKLLVWVVAGGLVLFVGVKTWSWVSTPTPEVAGDNVEVTETDWVKGDREAQTVLIEYGDFQCPACANYYPMIKRLHEEIPTGFKTVYRHIPLTSIHRNALISSYAAEAAGNQGKFWEMHDMLYEKQTEWSEETNASVQFIEYAKNIGLDEERFKSDIESDQVKQKVEANMTNANSLGINSTPTFYLNGQRIQPRSYDEFKNLVEDQIRGYSLQ